MTFFISRKRYSIGEVLKRIFFWNPGIAKVLAVERDVKQRNMNFAKVDRRGGTNREGALIRINTVFIPLLALCQADDFSFVLLAKG